MQITAWVTHVTIYNPPACSAGDRDTMCIERGAERERLLLHSQCSDLVHCKPFRHMPVCHRMLLNDARRSMPDSKATYMYRQLAMIYSIFIADCEPATHRWPYPAPGGTVVN